MKQFILNSEPDGNAHVRFEGGDYRYLARVRRLAPGEYFPALLPNGAEASVKVVSVDHKTLTGEICQVKTASTPLFSTPSFPKPSLSTPSLPPIYLFQALPKGDKMDLIVRQAAEGALTGIVPFTSEFSAPKIHNDRTQKFTRWQRIIKEARQQCGSPAATEIVTPVTLDELLLRWEQYKARQPGILGLLFHHLPLENKSLHGYLGNSTPEMVVLVVGPEGGFSSAEAGRFIAAGFKPFTIGDTILRTETAALYAAAAVRILLLERDSWETVLK